MSDILLFLLQGIPEMMGITALSLALVRVSLRWKVITCIGTLLALIMYIIRTLPFTFGLHIIIGIVVLTFILLRVAHIKPSKCLVAVFISYIILAFFELLIHKLFVVLTNMTIKEVISNTLLWTALGLLQAVLMNLLSIIVNKYRKPINGMWKI